MLWLQKSETRGKYLVLESPIETAVGIKASALATASSTRRAEASFLAARTSSCKPVTRPAKSSALTWATARTISIDKILDVIQATVACRIYHKHV